MLKMWNKIKNILRRQRGAAVVEVSFLVPLLLFLIVGSFLFSLYLLDVAAVKGNTIIASQRMVNCTTSEDNLRTFPKLMLASKRDYQKKEQLEQVVLEVKICGKIPWKGLLEYMQTEYNSTIRTTSIKDHRKQWMWSAGKANKKEE